MRLPRGGCRTASHRRPGLASSSLAALAIFSPLLSHAIDFETVPSPNLDLSDLGSIGIAGNFDGISLYEYEGQGGGQSSTNGAQSLLALLPNGALGTVISTDASISAMCLFTSSAGKMMGVVMGGNFTSLDGTKSTAIALFNPDTAQITPLDGLEGQVNAVWCDNERETVYIGGNFKGANSTNAIAWYGTEGWTNLPFAGFNGPVEAITKASNGHIIFGGSFTGLGNTSAPATPDGQTINLSTANISAQNSASTHGFSDPKNIVCSSGTDSEGNAWLLEDKMPGYWNAEFDFGFEPTKLRLWNTHQDGRGTKTFRFTALPINGILNVTYIDPATGKNLSCTNDCPLSSDPSVEYQDFHFVALVGMNGFQIDISDWYGDGAGLAGIELFENDIFSYAVSKFNEPICGNITFPSTATTTGPWSESPSLQSTSNYLTVELKGDITSDSASVVFTPDIQESGYYSVNMYTPGCVPDNTCSARGRVNVTGVMSTSTSNADFTTSLYQTNDYDKYDQIYFGYIEQSSDSFKPSVTLAPLAGQDLDSLTIVAQRVGFTLINSTGGLNGLFEFDPDMAVVNTSTFQDSTMDKLGSSFDQKSAVQSLVTSGEVTYVAGNFTSADHVNIVAVKGDKDVTHLDGGLNGQVLNMQVEGQQLYVGGGFTNTLSGSVKGLDYVAVYDTSKDSWSALGAGVDGIVEYVVPMLVNITHDTPETVMTFSGSFSECKAFDGFSAVPVDGFAVWVPSKNNWLQNINGSVPTYSGVLTASVLNLPNGDSVFAGAMSSAQMGANGAATLAKQGLGQFPVSIEAQPAPSNLQGRDVLSTSDISGVTTGIFYNEDGKNITVLAGHFVAQSSNGAAIDNLVMIDGNNDNSITGLGSSISAKSTFLAVDVSGSVLYAGGQVTGTVHGNDINGIVAYDMASQSFAHQPPSVSGANGTVSAIGVRPKNTDVYVGGSFKKAGALDCPGVCLYNVQNAQWLRPGIELAGDVECLMWVSDDQLIAGGNLLGNSTDQTFLASYSVSKDIWNTYPGSDGIPGPVSLITPASSDADQIWVAGSSLKDGSVFLMKYDGKKWQTAQQTLPAGTDLRGIQVFSLSKSHGKTDILDKNEVLMLTGSIQVPGFGSASAAIYNGTAFQPYLLTTSSDSSLGSVAKMFSQKDNFFSGSRMSFVIPPLLACGQMLTSTQIITWRWSLSCLSA